MATKLFPRSIPKSPTATFLTALNRSLSLAQGAAAVTQTDNTVATLAAGSNPQAAGTVAFAARAAGSALSAAGAVESSANIGAALFWISDPLAAVTIAGNITASLRCSESATQANYGIGAKVYRVKGNVVDAAFAQGSTTVEISTPGEATSSITLAVTSTAIAEGDQIAVAIFYVGIAGSAAGRTASLFYNGAAAGSGDTFFTFTETITAIPVRALQEVGAQQAVKRGALFCLGEKWAKRGKLWIPAADRAYALA